MIALFEQCARAAYPLRFYITSHFGKCAAVVPLRFSLCRPPLRALRVSKKDVMQSTQPTAFLVPPPPSQCASRMSRAALSQCASRLVALRACRAPRSVSALRAWGASRLFSPPALPLRSWGYTSRPALCPSAPPQGGAPTTGGFGSGSGSGSRAGSGAGVVRGLVVCFSGRGLSASLCWPCASRRAAGCA